MKITIIGAGNVGATCANILANKNIVREIIMLDIKKSFAKGKALDIKQSNSIYGNNVNIIGTKDYSITNNSEIIIITSGMPRKKGMTREDMVKTNAKIVENVAKKMIKFSPNAKFIVVSNPLDIMTYITYKTIKINPYRIFGMGATLDNARYHTLIAKEINCSPNDIQSLILGSHGETMIPLPRYTTISGIPLKEMIGEKKIKEIIEKTKKGGEEIIKLIGKSAWYAPGAAIAEMVEAIVKDSKRILPCCAWVKNKYNLNNIYIGVPVVLGKKGVEKIIELKLEKKEKEKLENSAQHIKTIINKL